MPALNRVQLIGRLGKDPETHHTPSGKNVSNFSLAVARRWRNSEGKAVEATDWFQIETWGRLAEICQAYLHKGRLIYVEGRLQTDRYEQDGATRYFTKVIARQMQILEPKPEEEEEEPVIEEDEAGLE